MKKETNRGLLPIVFALLLTGYFIAIIYKFPLIGIEVVERNNEWIVKEIYDNGWAASKLIDEGDKIELINGKNPEEHSTVQWFKRVEMAKTMTIVNKELNRHTLDISYDNVSTKQIIYLFLPIVFVIITILLSIFLYQKKNNQATLLLIYFLLALGMCYLSAYVSARGELVGRVVNIITLPSILILFAHFLTLYFVKFSLVFIKARTLVLLYTLNFTVIFVTIISSLLEVNIPIEIIELFFFFLLFCCLIFHIMQFNIKNRHTEGNHIIKILWFTILLSFSPFICLYAIPRIMLQKEFVSTEITAMFLLILPMMFVYLQLTERLFDIDFVFSRLKYYSLLSFPFAVCMVVLINLILKNDVFSSTTILIFLLVFVCTNFFLYLKELIDYKMRHHLFSEKNNFATSLYTFFQKAKYETKVNSLIAHLMNEIKDVLKVKNVIYIELLTESEGLTWSVKDRKNYPEAFVTGIETKKWGNIQSGTLKEIMDGFGIVIGGDYHHKNIIFFGLKKANTNLNIQERVWLETLAYFSSILLENFQVIEKLFEKIEDYKNQENRTSYPNWFSRLLFSLSEKERANLAMDLHDSVLQDQLQLLREIDIMQKKVKDSSVQRDLLQLKERMLDNIHLVRETCNELRPPLLSQLGIIQSIQHLIEQTKLRCEFVLKSELDYSIQVKDKEQELIIYRVIQELLSNAMKHSGATEVTLSLCKVNENTISLIYRDNGKGIGTSQLNDSFKTMGIFGIKERIKSINGTIVIDTASGKGTKITIEIQIGGGESDSDINR